MRWMGIALGLAFSLSACGTSGGTIGEPCESGSDCKGDLICMADKSNNFVCHCCWTEGTDAMCTWAYHYFLEHVGDMDRCE